ncbi:helix-turn-helix domain-containing protein [Aerophototrophica crusticola]|uniref:Helix-turn-helix domain-containing protein n=1 Tax=Aerophototrophica crusticola TaxID=1709002 RepID=A0A858R9V0_9PROT|nr:helix-turn-helix domain-containing protein [Rhodospirillaceae bacterium B3]
MATPRVTIDLLAMPEAASSCLYGLFDIFSFAGVLWSQIMGEGACEPLMDVRIVAAEKRPFHCLGGVPVEPQAGFADGLSRAVLVVPDILVPLDQPLPERLRPEVEWVRRSYENGAIVCSVCTGTLMLAATGLLDGEEATSHWGFIEPIRRFYPAVKLRPERILVPAGDGHRLVTAGGSASWNDLALYLIARFCGERHAVQTAKVLLISGHQEGQLPYAAMARSRQYADPAIAAAQSWIAENYARPNPVAGMLACTGLPERTFKRRFKAATGFTPLEYAQTLRLEEAKQALESTDACIDQVGLSVGYEDPAFFRSLFKRKTGLTPSQYRRKFAGLRPPPVPLPRREVVPAG